MTLLAMFDRVLLGSSSGGKNMIVLVDGKQTGSRRKGSTRVNK